MRVRVIKATEQTFWYADQIGEEFDVFEIHDDRKRGQWTVNDGDNNLCILKRDCESDSFQKGAGKFEQNQGI